MRKKISALIIGILFISSFAVAQNTTIGDSGMTVDGNVELSSGGIIFPDGSVLNNAHINGSVPGQPFQALQQQIDDLQNQLNNIQLIPGPQGEQGPPGEQGPAGQAGPQGPPGKSPKVVDAEGKEIGILIQLLAENYAIVYDTNFNLVIAYAWYPQPDNKVFLDKRSTLNRITNEFYYLEADCSGDIYSASAAYNPLGKAMYRDGGTSPDEWYYRDEEMPELVNAIYQSTHTRNNGCVNETGTIENLAAIRKLTHDNLYIDLEWNIYGVSNYIPPFKVVAE